MTTQPGLQGHQQTPIIVQKALSWEKSSGATFETAKTAIVHFTGAPHRSSSTPIFIKGKAILPTLQAKILGVIIDHALRYQAYIARVATKGLNAALALKRLRMLSPRSARQLFNATVVPALDYASNIWMYTVNKSAMAVLGRAQKIGACAITGAFYTVALVLLRRRRVFAQYTRDILTGQPSYI
jgi:hypothetical protein